MRLRIYWEGDEDAITPLITAHQSDLEEWDYYSECPGCDHSTEIVKQLQELAGNKGVRYEVRFLK